MHSWIPTTVANSLADLKSLYKEIERLNKNDPLGESLHFLSNWLIVRSCGHIEITEQACIEDLFDRCFGSVVHHYVDHTAFRTGRNPNPDNLIGLLKQIDPSKTLATKLKEFLRTVYQGSGGLSMTQNTYKEYLNTIVDSRNSIVHGYSFHITADIAMEYSKVTEAISDWYLACFVPQGEAEETILNGAMDERVSINEVRRQNAAQQLGIADDAVAN